MDGSGCLAQAPVVSSRDSSFTQGAKEVIQAYGRASVRKWSIAAWVSGGMRECRICSTSSFWAESSATISRIRP